MEKTNNYQVAIIGGGLAGLTCALLLARKRIKVALIEKKTYPFHRVCGEYLSREVEPFLTALGIDFNKLGANYIHRLRLSTPSGNNQYAVLKMGGIGISRLMLDHALFQLACDSKFTSCMEGTKVKEVFFDKDSFHILTSNETINADFVIGSHGKREVLDRQLERKFMNKRTGYMAVKYHRKIDYPRDEIGLDNFYKGYCGISPIESGNSCVCYMTRRSQLQKYGSIEALENEVLFKNPNIRSIFENSDPVYNDPQVINEISFARKSLVENHILMCGDSAGMITPLCGNGMAMAVRGAELLCRKLIRSGLLDDRAVPIEKRIEFEKVYTKAWKKEFNSRLSFGRKLQYLFGNRMVTSVAAETIQAIPPLKKWVVSRTHGKRMPTVTV